MKKISLLIIPAILFLSGCATYSLKKGEAPYNNGFIVTRYDRLIPEYTTGKDNSVPDEQVARERFKRRRAQVESYYKKMGYIENRFKQNFVDPPLFMLKAVFGIFRLPSIAIADYNYNHDPKYKESVDKKEDEEYKAEKARLKSLKDQLNAYIQEDLKQEGPVVLTEQKSAPIPEVKEKPGPAAEVKEPAKKEVLTKEEKAASAEASVPKKIEEPPVQAAAPDVSVAKPEEKTAPEAVPPKPEEKTVTPVLAKEEKPLKLPVAVITAKPVKGYSPLFVQFNGSKSYSPGARIVSYSWDFGDGDTSTKKNPTNSYWSTTYGKPRQYTAKLTVKNDKGITSEASVIIEVLTR